jgi:hypothetical protein
VGGAGPPLEIRNLPADEVGGVLEEPSDPFRKLDRVPPQLLPDDAHVFDSQIFSGIF